MKVDIGRVFSTAWATIKERFWLLVGMVVVYFAIQAIFGMVFGGVIGGAVFAMGAGASGLDSPEMLLGGLGIGMIVLLFIFYLAIFVLMFAQQCSMSALATPLQRLQFGDAFGVGFKGGMTFLGIIFFLILGYIAFVVVAALLGVVLSFMGDAAPLIVAILFFPALVYLGLRFAVLVPVVAVDKVFNPIKALQRSWQITGGNVLAILVVYIAVSVVALALLGIPFLMMAGSFAALESGDAAGAMGALGAVFGIFLLFIPLTIIYSIVTVTVTACLHAELSDTGTQNLEETFG